MPLPLLQWRISLVIFNILENILNYIGTRLNIIKRGLVVFRDFNTEKLNVIPSIDLPIYK